ncbi:MAG: hypothetical protein EXR60_05205 [Dehalococcoidia bacterium]|nr:hypothetical protein [Dehalococcoidia bacterium]
MDLESRQQTGAGAKIIAGALTTMQEEFGYWLEEDDEAITLMKASGGGPPPPPPRIVNRVPKRDAPRQVIISRLKTLIKG